MNKPILIIPFFAPLDVEGYVRKHPEIHKYIGSYLPERGSRSEWCKKFCLISWDYEDSILEELNPREQGFFFETKEALETFRRKKHVLKKYYIPYWVPNVGYILYDIDLMSPILILR